MEQLARTAGKVSNKYLHMWRLGALQHVHVPLPKNDGASLTREIFFPSTQAHVRVSLNVDFVFKKAQSYKGITNSNLVLNCANCREL